MTARPLRIGFDVAQTCVERAGCAWYADSLVRAMARVAPEHVYLLYHHFGAWINADASGGTRIENAPQVQAPLRDLPPAEAAAIWRVGETGGAAVADAEPLGRPDIVHANCYLAPRVQAARLVFTIYDVSFWRAPEFTTESNRLICQAGVLEALRHADGFAFISESARREFDLILPGWLERSRKPWAVTPLAPRPAAVANAPAAAALPEDEAFWLAVGSLEPRKNYGTLLDALELYWRRSARPRPLWIAGGAGWNSEDVRARLTALEGEGKARRLGYVPEERLQALYAQARALLFPSWYEGFGLPVVEAMAEGCPVICSDRASLPEVGGEAAVYVDPASAESLAAAMLALEGDPGRRDALADAARRQAQRFSWEGTARATLEFYQQVLAGNA